MFAVVVWLSWILVAATGIPWKRITDMLRKRTSRNWVALDYLMVRVMSSWSFRSIQSKSKYIYWYILLQRAGNELTFTPYQLQASCIQWQRHVRKGNWPSVDVIRKSDGNSLLRTLFGVVVRTTLNLEIGSPRNSWTQEKRIVMKED